MAAGNWHDRKLRGSVQTVDDINEAVILTAGPTFLQPRMGGGVNFRLVGFDGDDGYGEWHATGQCNFRSDGTDMFLAATGDTPALTATSNNSLAQPTLSLVDNLDGTWDISVLSANNKVVRWALVCSFLGIEEDLQV